MALAYPGGTVRNDLYTAIASRAALVENLKTTLVAAGWTQLEAVKALNRLTGTGDPANNDTVTLDAKTYTFKTTINNANDGEVTRGVSLANSLSNLHAAITLGAGAGTAYSSATTLHPTIESYNLTSTTLDVRAKTGGSTGVGLATTEASSALSFTNTDLAYGGYKIRSATTPEFLGMRVYIFHDTSTGTPNFDGMRIVVYDQDGTLVLPGEPDATTAKNNNTGAFGLRLVGNGQDMRFIANKYQCFITINNTGTTQFAQVQFGVPKVFTFQAAKSITNATNASPIVITTSAVHGYTTGDVVTIRGVGGNTAANVTSNAITVLTTTTFSLDGSTGNGAYTSGGRVAEDNLEVLNAVWAVGSSAGPNSLRNRLHARDSTEQHYILNVSAVNNQSAVTGTGNVRIHGVNSAVNSEGGDESRFFNGSYVTTEPWVSWSTAVAGTPFILGMLWGAALIRKAIVRQDTGTFDSHNWHAYTDNNSGDSSNMEGTLVLEIP